MAELSEIIQGVKHPSFNDEMIDILVQGLSDSSNAFYHYIQDKNQLRVNSTDAIDREAEKGLWAKKEPGFNQKDKFRHMGGLSDIDYAISRLYVNCSKQDLMKIAELFTDKCAEKGLPNYFKYSSNNSNRSDQMVIYSNLATLGDYIGILQEIGRENPDIMQRCGRPPMLTGTIDEWIGIGDEPAEKGTSYTEIRANIIEAVLKKCAPIIKDKDDIEEYTTVGIDYDRVRAELRRALEDAGINMDTFSFNAENVELYMQDEQARQEYDARRKQEVRDQKNELIQKKKTQESYLEEQIPIRELRILKQMGALTEGMDYMVVATASRYGLLSDLARKTPNMSTVVQEKYGLPGNYLVSDDNVIRFRKFTETHEMSDEEKKELFPKMQEDVAQYYTKFFNEEQEIIDETLERYAELDRMPASEDDEATHIEREDLYSKLMLLSHGKPFFEAIGISSEQTELVCDRAGDLLARLDREREEQERPEREAWKRKIDQEYLEAVLEEFANDPSITPEQIQEALAREGIGISDINQTTQAMKKSLEPNLNKGNELSN